MMNTQEKKIRPWWEAGDNPVGWVFQRKDENRQLQILPEFNRGSKNGLRCTISFAGDKELRRVGGLCGLQPRVAPWGPAQDSHFWSVTKPSFDILCLSSYFPPDIGLFGADVVTDYWNGANLIAGGDVIWGGIMVSLTFLPMTIGLLFVAFFILFGKEGRWVGLLLLLLLPLLTAIATPTYMIFIIVAGFAKLYKPVIEDEDELLGGWLSGEIVNFFAPFLRMLELVGESCPQALLGELAFVLL